MNSTPETLTIGTAVSLGAIIDAALRNAPVARAMDGGTVVYGTARTIGTNGGAMIHNGDVRDAFLRVTTSGGIDVFWSMRELIGLYRDGLFILDYSC